MKTGSDLTGQGLSPTELLPPHFRCQSQQVPRLPTTSVQFRYRSQVSTSPSSVSTNFLEQLTELRETLIYIYQVLKAIIKGQPDKVVHKVMSGRVLSEKVFTPGELGYNTLQVDMFTNLEVL